ncbi:MAG: hypothetical protein WCK37_05275, partial [Candidatus Falkowbacteria bacterium]
NFEFNKVRWLFACFLLQKAAPTSFLARGFFFAKLFSLTGVWKKKAIMFNMFIVVYFPLFNRL